MTSKKCRDLIYEINYSAPVDHRQHNSITTTQLIELISLCCAKFVALPLVLVVLQLVSLYCANFIVFPSCYGDFFV